MLSYCLFACIRSCVNSFKHPRILFSSIITSVFLLLIYALLILNKLYFIHILAFLLHEMLPQNFKLILLLFCFNPWLIFLTISEILLITKKEVILCYNRSATIVSNLITRSLAWSSVKLEWKYFSRVVVDIWSILSCWILIIKASFW